MESQPIKSPPNLGQFPLKNQLQSSLLFIIVGGNIFAPLNALLLAFGYSEPNKFFWPAIITASIINALVIWGLIFLPYWHAPSWFKAKSLAFGLSLLTLLWFIMISSGLAAIVLAIFGGSPEVITGAFLFPMPLVPTTSLLCLIGPLYRVPKNNGQTNSSVKQTTQILSWFALGINFALVLPIMICTFLIWGLL